METFVIDVTSTIVAASVIAFVGFMFRNRIRKVLNGVDLLAADRAPDIEFIDMQYITDLKYNKSVLFLINNSGNINIANIKLYKCSMENAGNPTFLLVERLPYERQFTSVGSGNGETMQIVVDTHYFKLSDAYPDVRLFVEMTSEDGSYFRATITRIEETGLINFGEGGFFVDRIGRVNRPLPFWRIATDDTREIERIQKKYDIDLSVG